MTRDEVGDRVSDQQARDRRDPHIDQRSYQRLLLDRSAREEVPQDAAEGARLYVRTAQEGASCVSCHGPDPATNPNNILRAAGNLTLRHAPVVSGTTHGVARPARRSFRQPGHVFALRNEG